MALQILKRPCFTSNEKLRFVTASFSRGSFATAKGAPFHDAIYATSFIEFTLSAKTPLEAHRLCSR